MNVIVAGTLVAEPIGQLFYGPLAKEIDATVECLPCGGLANPEKSVQRIIDKIGPGTTLIGHSQGGLVAAVVGMRRPDLVERVVTICAPLKGTPVAPWWGFLPPAVRGMSKDSSLVWELERFDWYTSATELHMIGASKDNLVPLWSAIPDELFGQRYLLPNGHADIILDRELSLLLQNKVLPDCL